MYARASCPILPISARRLTDSCPFPYSQLYLDSHSAISEICEKLAWGSFGSNRPRTGLGFDTRTPYHLFDPGVVWRI